MRFIELVFLDEYTLLSSLFDDEKNETVTFQSWSQY